MIVDNGEIELGVDSLELDDILDRAQVVSDVKVACGLDACEDNIGAGVVMREAMD